MGNDKSSRGVKNGHEQNECATAHTRRWRRMHRVEERIRGQDELLRDLAEELQGQRRELENYLFPKAE